MIYQKMSLDFTLEISSDTFYYMLQIVTLGQYDTIAIFANNRQCGPENRNQAFATFSQALSLPALQRDTNHFQLTANQKPQTSKLQQNKTLGVGGGGDESGVHSVYFYICYPASSQRS